MGLDLRPIINAAMYWLRGNIMSIVKVLAAGILVSSLITPAIAASDRPVRPSVKAATKVVAHDRSLVVRNSARAGAEMESSNSLIGLPLLALLGSVAAVAVVATAVAVATNNEPASPGS